MSVVSAGPSPGDTLNPVAVEAMAEEGIDISQAKSAVLTEKRLGEAFQ